VLGEETATSEQTRGSKPSACNTRVVRVAPIHNDLPRGALLTLASLTRNSHGVEGGWDCVVEDGEFERFVRRRREERERGRREEERREGEWREEKRRRGDKRGLEGAEATEEEETDDVEEDVVVEEEEEEEEEIVSNAPPPPPTTTAATTNDNDSDSDDAFDMPEISMDGAD